MVAGMQWDLSQHHDAAVFKDFMKYYASSRNGQIASLPTVHSILTMWYGFVGFYNCQTKSRLPPQVRKDVVAVCPTNFTNQ